MWWRWRWSWWRMHHTLETVPAIPEELQRRLPFRAKPLGRGWDT